MSLSSASKRKRVDDLSRTHRLYDDTDDDDGLEQVPEMPLDDETDEEEWEDPDKTRLAGAPFNDSRQRKRRRDNKGAAPADLRAIFVYQRCSPRGAPIALGRSSAPPNQEATVDTEPYCPDTLLRHAVERSQKQPPTDPPPRLGSQSRHFHMTRASMAATAALSLSTQFYGAGPLGISKRSCYATTVFAEPNVRRLRSAPSYTPPPPRQQHPIPPRHSLASSAPAPGALRHPQRRRQGKRREATPLTITRAAPAPGAGGHDTLKLLVKGGYPMEGWNGKTKGDLLSAE
ncbi:hypothetical protein B0T11DRAFT_318984 [Plectosphaerella cucumerina]|uniref:Uncharacterized protein n=1 Tax=Plectosphaerella cucumerina TaxID=40658 RepID=A0A8K0TP14_9PEZI|nr:hypothetical protein B0T11DRAFT_318984 [Plectosphaerella cucumerina]